MRGRWRTPLLAGTALVAGLTAAGGTFALWTADSGPGAVTITAGDLDIEPHGEAVWTETSADVATAPRTIDPTTFLVRQGDTVEVAYGFTTYLQGDNLVGQLEVDFSDPASLPGGVSASYTVYDAAEQPLAPPAVLGTATTFDDPSQQLAADDSGRTDSYTLVISLDFTGMADRFSAESAVQLTDLGGFDVELHQVRTGVGFQ